MPVYLHSDLDSAIRQLSDPDLTKASPIHRGFVIGGASLYSATLALPPSAQAAFVNRILLTRIISPLFEQCDVYIPNLLENAIIDGEEVNWQRASHPDLQAWAGFEVPEGVQQENGVEYEFQMWVRGC